MIYYILIYILAELPGVAREKRLPLHEFMALCTTQTSFGRAMPKAMTTLWPKNLSSSSEAFVP